MEEGKTEIFRGINPFKFDITYVDINAESPDNVFHSHVHEECEIYINLSGDVSFMVGDRMYPISPGSIIVTSPFEYHHCVYHSNKRHRHFWILLSVSGNDWLLDTFFQRDIGERNLLKLSKEDTESLVALCHEMIEEDMTEENKYIRFFQLLHLLKKADNSGAEAYFPQDVLYAVDTIGRNFTQSISVRQIANEAGVSVNTLERHFTQYLNMSPSAYIRQKRLARAIRLLSEGATVTEASERSGFSDYSGFIALFKSVYGVTPLQYKKDKQKERHLPK